MAQAFEVANTATGASSTIVAMNEVAAMKTASVNFGWAMNDITVVAENTIAQVLA